MLQAIFEYQTVICELTVPALPNKVLIRGTVRAWRPALPRLRVRAGATVEFASEESEKRDFIVETVKGAAAFEQSTLVAVTEARSKVDQLSAGAAKNLANDPAAFQKFQEAQDGLSSALSRLMVVVEKYPELKANQNFLNLQSQLEGTENGIANERRRFNEAAQTFNTKRQSDRCCRIVAWASALSMREVVYPWRRERWVGTAR